MDTHVDVAAATGVPLSCIDGFALFDKTRLFGHGSWRMFSALLIHPLSCMCELLAFLFFCLDYFFKGCAFNKLL